MVAGRELDLLVAEKVMGYCVCVLTSDDYLNAGWSVPVPPSWVGHAEGRRTSSSIYVVDSAKGRWHCTEHDLPIPPGKTDYSTDIAAAWEVVEKLSANEDWDEYPFEIHKNYDFKPTWTATFNDYEHEGWSEVSAPHAICLAALAAVGALPTPQEDQ